MDIDKEFRMDLQSGPMEFLQSYVDRIRRKREAAPVDPLRGSVVEPNVVSGPKPGSIRRARRTCGRSSGGVQSTLGFERSTAG